MDSEEEEVDSSKRCSAAKYYTTSFPCHVFKKHFGDGSNTYSEMVDDWERFTNIGVKISEVGIRKVYCHVPDHFVEHLPSFIQPWMPVPVNIVSPSAIHFG
ncbi:hypothetical protein [Nostoc sp. MS1]|uniref:hypothetical protein n=1 Tax=Nostoc sp. MS1 TaxID=2764711 RepID=UPI001CC60ABB|nr:hypothetical protein [Nostoc sp. MS1]BCL40199.1 hypothetical protein NSMS1_66460 [Nostoc sp. MS1]